MNKDERLIFNELTTALRHATILNRELTGILADLQTRIPAARQDGDVEAADDSNPPSPAMPAPSTHRYVQQEPPEFLKQYQ